MTDSTGNPMNNPEGIKALVAKWRAEAKKAFDNAPSPSIQDAADKKDLDKAIQKLACSNELAAVLGTARQSEGMVPAPLVEAFARAIYEQWSDRPGYVPWVERGNSDMQCKARRVLHNAMLAAAPADAGEGCQCTGLMVHAKGTLGYPCATQPERDGRGNG